jgi:hypothetical protein
MMIKGSVTTDGLKSTAWPAAARPVAPWSFLPLSPVPARMNP